MLRILATALPLASIPALVGCSTPAPEQPPAPSPTPNEPALATPATATTATPATATDPTTAAIPSGSDTTPPTPEPTPPIPVLTTTAELHVIARAGTTMMLHPLVDGSLLASAGPLVLRVDERGELVHDPAMLRGLENIRDVSADDDEFDGVSAWWPVALGGRWPDAVYLSMEVASAYRGDGAEADVHRWDGQAWAKVDTRTNRYEWYPAEIHPWIDSSLLARRVYRPWYPGHDPFDDGEGPTEQQVEASARAIGQAKKIVVIRGEPKAPAAPATVTAFASLATGEIFAVTGDDPPNLVRLDTEGGRHTIALPGKDVHVRGVIADGPDRAWVFGTRVGPKDEDERAWLVRVHGKKASMADAPNCRGTGLASFVALDSGTQWATCGAALDDVDAAYFADTPGTLWHRAPGKAWARWKLPPRIDDPRRVVARHEGDVWVVAYERRRGGVLLHSRPRSTVLELPDLPELGRQVIEWNDPLPVAPYCSYPYVPLRSPPEDAATVKAALDGPLEALKPKSPVVLMRTTIRGQTELGLQLVDPDDARGDAKQVASAARKALGNEAVDAPRCWYARELPAGEIATWGRPR